MTRRAALGILTLTAILFDATLARADDASSLQTDLNESVVTTASKTAETASSAPATSTTITSDDLRRYGLRNLAEALSYISLGFFSSYNLANDDVGARGIIFPQNGVGANEPGTHILLLINGHMVNEPFAGTARFGRGWGVPLELVDHIEVINGPGSVLYGSNAMFGVINIVTKNAKDYRGTHLIAEAQPLTGIRAGAGAGYDFNLWGARNSVTFQVEYARHDGPDIRYPMINTGVDPLSPSHALTRYTRLGEATGVWGGTASHVNYSEAPSAILRFVRGDFELNLRGSAFRRGDPPLTIYAFDEPIDQVVERSAFVDAKYHHTLSAVTDVSARVYADVFDRQQSYLVAQRGGNCAVFVDNCEIRLPSASRWVGAEVQTSFDWFQNTRLVSLLGFDGRLRHGTAHSEFIDGATGRNLTPSLYSISYNDMTFGAYGQQTWQATDWLNFNAGARLDYDERFPAVLSPRIAAAVQPWWNGTLKAIYVEAFRAPTFYESFNYGGPQLLSEGLRPETVRSAEASLEQKVGTQRLLFGVFRSWWDNMIENHTFTPQEVRDAFGQNKVPSYIPYSPFLQLRQDRNISTIDNYGFNGAYQGSVGALRYGANVTAAIARRNEFGAEQPLELSPQMVANARVSYDFRGDWPVIALATKYYTRRIVDNAYTGNFQPTPYAPEQLELRGTISGPLPVVVGLSYRVSANYSFASQGPYSVGPVTRSTDLFSQPFLNPIQRFQSLVGLQYDFL